MPKGWDIIQEEIVARDVYCRAGCRSLATEAFAFTGSPRALNGQLPSLLVGLCDDCAAVVKSLDPRSARIWVMEHVALCSQRRGESNPRIGRWYASEHNRNLGVAEIIRKRLMAEAPKFYNRYWLLRQ